MPNPEHLALLQKCIDTNDFAEWNTWLKAERERVYDFRPDLHEADLRGADLRGANLIRVDLTGAYLSGANFHRAALRAADLAETHARTVDLGEANLSGVNLQRADLHAANLARADLGETNLFAANLGGAHLREADLGAADLRVADLRAADLRGASLLGALLRGTNLREADLTRALVGNSLISGPTIFADVNLSHVRGLETLMHYGPSVVGIDTLYKSGGDIPESFLRGCGVPDTVITFARSLVGKPIDYYSAFISYSSKDSEIAERLHADLQARGVRVWIALKDLEIGQPIMAGIDAAIRSYDKLMVILSENSIHSEWVNFEVTNALQREIREKRRVLFPIRIDDTVLRLNESLSRDTDPERHERYSWVNQVCQRHIGDFTRWKEHDAYKQAFERLLRDLQSRDAPPASK